MEFIKLYVMIVFSGMMFGAEFVASHLTQSLALLVSAYHMLYNILSLLLLVISHRKSKEVTLKNTFGWARIKVLGMLVNMLFVCALCFAVCVEAVQTMVHASHENTEPKFPFLLLCLGILNFTLNFICFLLIGGYTHHQGCSMIIQGDDSRINYVLAPNSDVTHEARHGPDYNLCSTTGAESGPENRLGPQRVSGGHKLLDMMRDTSSSLSVIACSCIILLLDGLILKYADSTLAVASVVVLVATTCPFIRESGLILLQSIPNHVDVAGLSSRLRKEFPAIHNVHDFHVWRLTASEVIATVHIILSSADIYSSISSKINEFFENEGINLVTVQPEFHEPTTLEEMDGSECILQCSSNNNCGALTCCGPTSNVRQRNCAVPAEAHCPAHSTEVTIPSTANGSSSNFARFDISHAHKYDFSRFKTATETSV